MKAFFTLLTILVFNIGYAQSPVNTSAKITAFKGQLIQDWGIMPYFGFWTGNIPLKFKVIDPNQLSDAEEIREVYFFGTNESFGKDFLKKDNLYYIRATSITIDWKNLFNKEKSNWEVVNKKSWLCQRITTSL